MLLDFEDILIGISDRNVSLVYNLIGYVEK